MSLGPSPLIIDFHTHAFPDAVAERAMPQLEAEGHVKGALNGKVSALLASMDRAGIAVSVLDSIATKPTQFSSILTWSKSIALVRRSLGEGGSPRLFPFPSVHPADADAVAKVQQIADAGFKGIKLHPYYQDFYLDEPRLDPIYARLEACGLILLCHTGFNIAFERIRRAEPERIARVVERFPKLKFVSTHFGAWEDWDEVRGCLLGKPIYMDTAYSIQFMRPEVTREFLCGHPQEYLLFGTDSPWGDQAADIAALRAFRLAPEREAALFGLNAQRLLGLGC